MPKIHNSGEPRRFPDICFGTPKLMLFWEPNGFPDICFWCPRLIFFFDSPDICFWCTKLLYRLFESPASFLTFVFGAQNTCFFSEIPASFLTFVVGVQNSCFWRAQKVSWHLFWNLKSHAFLRAQWFSWHLFLVPKTHVFFLTAPTFAFGAQTLVQVVWEPGEFPDICFWRPKHIFFLRSKRVSWHLLLVSKLMFLESPEGFLTFVLVPKIHVLF